MAEYEDNETTEEEEGSEEEKEKHWLVVDDLKKFAKNIGDQMSDEQKKKLGAMVCDDVDEDLASRENGMKESWDRQAKLYVGKPDQSPLSQRANAPNMHTPGASVAIDQYTARAAKYLFPTDSVAKAEGTGSEDKDRAWRVERLLNLFVEKRIPRFRRTGETAVKQSALFGLSALKSWWNPETETIDMVSIPAEDFIISHLHDGTLETAQRLTHRMHMTRDDIRQRIKSELFCEEAWDLEDSTQEIEDDGLAQTRKEIDGWEPSDNASDPGPMDIYEQHRLLDLDGDGIGEPYIVTVHADTQKVLRVVSRIVENRNGEEETVDFFTAWEFDYNPLGFYSLGIGSKTEGLNILQNSLANIMLFLALRNGFPPKFCTKNAFKTQGDRDYELDEWMEAEMSVDDLSKEMFIAPTVPPPPVLMDLYNEAGRQTREVVSITDVMQGQEQPHNQAATTTKIIQQESMEMFNGSFRRMIDSLTDLLNKFYQLIRLNLSDEDYNEMLGDTGQEEYMQWQQATAQWEQLVAAIMQYLEQQQPPPPELLMQLQQTPQPPEFAFSVDRDFDDSLDIIPTADPNLTSESERMKVAQAVLEQVMPDPQASPKAKWAARKQYYAALRVPAAVALAINPEPQEPGPPPNLGPLETLVALLRGQQAAVLPNQDHGQYIAAIEEYKERDQGSWWQNTAPETKEAIERHKQERMAAALEQEAQSGQQASVPALEGGEAPEAPIVGGAGGMGPSPGGEMVPS